MTKTSFTQASTVLPGFLLLEHHPDPITDQPTRLPEGTFKKAQDLIADGMMPLLAFRTAFDVSCDDIATAIIGEADHYRKLERGEVEMGAEDAFCLGVYFGVMPYHLISPDTKPMPFPILQASLKLYDLLDGNSALKGDAYNTIMDEALPARSIEKMGLERHRIVKHPLNDLTVTFIDVMLRGDSTALPKEEASANRLADDFVFSLYEQQENFEESVEELKKQRKATWEDLKRLGGELYREVKNDDVTWENVWAGLKSMKSVFGKDGIVDYYKTQAVSVGLDVWPKVAKDDYIIDERFVGSWKKAHAVHVKKLARYLTLDAREDAAQKQLNAFNVRVGHFEKWKDNNGALLGQFANRQEIIRHPDFKHMRKRMTQGVKALPSPRR